MKAGVLIAVLLAATAAGVIPGSARTQTDRAVNASAASERTNYPNAAIADTALRYVGKPGWTACADAGRSGLTGGPTPVQPQFDASGKLVKEGDGQCRAFVNCIVWMASGHTQWLGGGANYFSSFLGPNGGPSGVEIKSIESLVKGDIVQQGASAAAPNLHTYIIVARASRKTDTKTTRTFTVVDSNHDYKESVLAYARTITLGPNERAFRLGSMQSGSASPSLVSARNYARRTYIRPRGGRRVHFRLTDYRTSVVAKDGSTITAFAIFSTRNGLAANSSWAVLLFRGTRFLGWASNRDTFFLQFQSPTEDAIRVEYAVYEGDDPTCCPSYRKVVAYRWSGSRIVADGRPPLIYGHMGSLLHLEPNKHA